MSAYADPSFLVSLYVLDANSTLAAARMKRAKLPLLLSSFGELELVNAISLRLFRKEISASAGKASLGLLKNDVEAGILMSRPLTPAVFERAKQLARKRTPRLGTRSLDILHVAAALVLQADGFYTFDTRQARLAEVEALPIS
ncbi:MAG: type II toxin-antitoxin system VapC family toxin [Candidatus Acidiferrum sp.]